MTQSYSTTETKEVSGVNSLVFTMMKHIGRMFKMKENKDSESSPKRENKTFFTFQMCERVKPTLAVTIIPSFQHMHAWLPPILRPYFINPFLLGCHKPYNIRPLQ